MQLCQLMFSMKVITKCYRESLSSCPWVSAKKKKTGLIHLVFVLLCHIVNNIYRDCSDYVIVQYLCVSQRT